MSAAPTFLFVLPWSLEHVGGVNQVVLNLAREARRDGRYRPLVLVADWSAPTPVWGEYHGVPTVHWRLRSPNPALNGPKGWLGRWRCARFQREFLRFCAEHQVCIVNCHYLSTAASALAPALAARALPLIVSVHGTDVTSAAAASPAEQARTRQLLDACRSVVAPSRNMAERTQSELQLKRLPAIVHNGLDAAAFRALAAHSSPTGVPVGRTLLSIGKFEPQKGQDVLLRAFAALAPEQPDLNLCLIGARAESLEGLQRLARQLDCADRVRFLVDLPHAQVAGHLRTASVFVLPSRQESFGIVILEAGALHVPVVASRVGGIPEIIEHGESGRLVNADDVGTLTDVLRETLRAPVEADRRAMRLAERVNDHFSWERAYAQYLELLP